MEIFGIGINDGEYDGSRRFIWLADLCGLSVDLINFLISQLLALFLASLFRSFLHPSKVSSGIRHAYGLSVGLCLGYFCFGKQAIHLAGLPALCYVVLRTQNPQIVQRIILVVSMLYLSYVHLHRLYYDYGSSSLDITGPLMIITQKVTSLAFSIHDGVSRDERELSKSQQFHAVRKLPSALEYFSFLLHFQGLMAGPLVFYKDYIEFIEGYQILKHTPSSNSNLNKNLNGTRITIEPSPTKAVVKKVIGCLICAFVFMKFSTIYPIESLKDNDFSANTSFLYKFWFIMTSTTIVRFKYYHAWLLADAICNNSGLGFNGYDKDGNAKWDLISNINVVSFELATNFRDAINNWNLGTNRWLRNVVYERVPKKYGTVLTFGLSALWHGFYPGYYITFACGALGVTSARTARALFRYRFQDTAFKRRTYDIITILATRAFMGYTTFPFVLLEFQASLQLYLNVYMCLHLVSLITLFVLPNVLRNEKRSTSSRASTEKTKTDDSTGAVDKCDINETTKTTATTDKLIVVTNTNGVNNGDILEHINKNGVNGNGNGIMYGIHDNDKDNLSYMIREKFDSETRNIENFIDKTVDKTVTGIVELKDDLMKMGNDEQVYLNGDGLRQRNFDKKMENENFIRKEIEALNNVVQQNNVLPAVLSNGHAK
jgi:lysophospholipid acyltransferase 1/2